MADAQPEAKPKTDEKLAKGLRLIRYHALGAGAVGLVPVPILDLTLVGGVQLNLIRSLAKLYDMPFSEEIGKSLISALIGASAPLASLSLLQLATPVAMLGVSLGGAASTYALGKVFVQHFESGGTFLSFKPEKLREHFKREQAKAAASPTGVPDDVEEDYGGIKP